MKLPAADLCKLLKQHLNYGSAQIKVIGDHILSILARCGCIFGVLVLVNPQPTFRLGQ